MPAVILPLLVYCHTLSQFCVTEALLLSVTRSSRTSFVQRALFTLLPGLLDFRVRLARPSHPSIQLQ